MGMGFAPTWLRQVSPPPCFTKPLSLTTAYADYATILISDQLNTNDIFGTKTKNGTKMKIHFWPKAGKTKMTK